MSFADKARQTSGGTVEGTITDYEFTNYFPLGDDPEPGDNVYMRLEITPAGASEPVSRPLYLGSGRYLVICDEDGEAVEAGKDGLLAGKTLKGGEDGEVDEDSIPRLYDGGGVFKFVSTLEDAGFPAESKFPDPSEDKIIDFRKMIDWRIRLGQEQDVDGQMAAGKKKLGSKANGKSEDEILEAGKRSVTTGKHKGKKFNLTFDKVVKVFSPDEDSDGKPAKKATNGSGKAVVGKSKKAAEETDDEDAPAVSQKKADKFLIAVVGAQPKSSVDKKGLALAITRYAAKIKMDNEERDAMRAFIIKNDFAYIADAADREVVEVSKKGIVSVAAEDEDDDDE